MAALCMAPCAGAEVVKSIQLDSAPPGAQVFLLRGAERVAIGTTPLRYEARFHSEMSVLRLRFERAGYEGTTLEATPARDRLVAELEGTRLVADPSAQKDPGLRTLQARLADIVTKAIRASLASAGMRGMQLAAPAQLRSVASRVYIEVLLAVPEDDLDAGLRAGKGEAVRSMWRSAGARLAAELRRTAGDAGVHGVIIEATPGRNGPGFSVSSRAEATTEIACIPGAMQVYDSCATRVATYENYCNPTGQCFTRQTGTRCQGGMRSQYSACATRGPVTRYRLKTTPQVAIQASQFRLIAVSEWAAENEPPPALLHLDASGRVLFEEGQMPAALKQAVEAR